MQADIRADYAAKRAGEVANVDGIAGTATGESQPTAPFTLVVA